MADFFKNMARKGLDSGRNSLKNDSTLGQSSDFASNTANEMSDKLKNKAESIGRKIEDKATDIGKDLTKKGVKKAAKAIKKAVKAGKDTAKIAGKTAETATRTATTAGTATTGAATGTAAGASAGAAGGAAAGAAGTAATGTAAAGTTAAAGSTAAGATGATVAGGWIILLVVLVVLILVLLVWWIWLNADSNKQNEQEYYVDYQGHTIVIEPEWDERLTLSYYMTFADKSYYYTIDNDSTIYQADIEKNKVQDKFLRESSFALNVNLIKYLDETLNINYSMPEQIIKPVYNTCSTGESTDGYCKTKELTDKDGNLAVVSQGYYETKNVCDNIDDENSENVSCGEGRVYKKDINQSSYSTSKELSTSSWGLAPIIHYKKYEEKKWVQDINVGNVKYYDDEFNEQNCTYKNCPDEIKALLKVKGGVNDISDNGKINKANINSDKINEGKARETKKNAYLIDSVATSVGTVSNEVLEETAKTGEIYSTNIVIPYEKKKTISLKNSEATDEEWTKNGILRVLIIANGIQKNTTTYETLRKIKYGDSATTFQSSNSDAAFINQMNSQGQYDTVLYSPNNVKTLTKNLKDGELGLYDEIGNKVTAVMIKEINFSNCISITEKNGTYTCRKASGEETVVNINSDTYKYIHLGDAGDNKLEAAPQVDWVHLSGDGDKIRESGIKATKIFNFVYSVKGDYWSTEYKYSSNAPDTSNIDNGDYIKTYIGNYTTYYPYKLINEEYDGMTFKEIFASALGKAEGEEKLITDISQINKAQYTSDLGKLIMQMYGDKVFLNREDFIAANMQEIDELGEDYETKTEALPLGIKSKEYGLCVQKLMKMSVRNGYSAYGLVKLYSSYYGIDPDLIVAMGAQSGCDTNMWQKTIKNTDTNEYSMFKIGKNWVGQNLTAFNYVSNEYDNFKLSDGMSADGSIQFVAMRLSNLLDKYNGNLLLALQAYNMGTENVDNIISAYINQNSLPTDYLYRETSYYDTGWLSYREIVKSGNVHYIENVMQYLPATKANVTSNFNNKSSQFIFSNIAPDENLTTNDTLDEKYYLYWYKNKNLIYKNWNKFYVWKPQEALTIKTDKNKFPETAYEADKNITKYIKFESDNYDNDTLNTVLANLLSKLDGTTVESNMDLSELEWKKKFTKLFSNNAIVNIEIDTSKIGEYFSHTPVEPIKNVFIVYRGFSSKYNLKGKAENYDDILIAAPAGTEVRAILDGTVTERDNNCVTIVHSTTDTKKHDVSTTYCNIDIDKNIELNKKVKTEDVLGKLLDVDKDVNINGEEQTQENSQPVLSFKLFIDGNAEDGSFVLKGAKTAQYYNSGLSAGLIKEANEGSHRMLDYSLSHIEELEEKLEPIDFFNLPDWELLDKLNSVEYHITSLSWWRYSLNGPNYVHGGMDYGWTASCADGSIYCNYLHSFGTGILLKYDDGYPDNGFIENYGPNGGAANYTQVLYKGTNGHLYVFSFIHQHQGATTNAFQNLESSFIEEGQIIGVSGNSGNCAGAHQHIEVMDYGEQSLQEFFEFWKTKIDRLYIRVKDPANPASRCENVGPPCMQRPITILKGPTTTKWPSNSRCPVDTEEKKKFESDRWVEITNKGC